MTGREMIVYIMEHELEDKDIFKILFDAGNTLNAYQAAEKFKVGISTINAWVKCGYLEGVICNGELRIPADAEPKRLNGGKEHE